MIKVVQSGIERKKTAEERLSSANKGAQKKYSSRQNDQQGTVVQKLFTLS